VSRGGSRNTRRPIKLTKEQLDYCKSEHQFVELTRQLTRLKKGTEEYDTIRKRREQVLAKSRNKKLASVRAGWNDSQAVDDIEQLHDEEKSCCLHPSHHPGGGCPGWWDGRNVCLQVASGRWPEYQSTLFI
jgi:hypothetical protein